MPYKIMCRYEYMGRGGKTWTKWFYNSDQTEYETEDDAKMKVASLNAKYKKSKMRREYKIERES